MSKRTGVGLIGAAAERVQNENSLFYEALKKLVNATEQEIGAYLKIKDSHTIPSILSPLGFGNQVPKIRHLDGNRLLYDSNRLIYVRGSQGLSEYYVPTAAIELRIDEIIFNGSIKRIFNSLPGVWSQKWLSQNQIVEIADTLGYYFPPADKSMFVLCKKNELLPVDDDNPADNLIVLNLMPRTNGKVNVYNIPLDEIHYRIKVNDGARIISPL